MKDFDGVVCFGGADWWYHNRGHYDMQMMRELGKRVPVLYVNSIGIRVPTPSEGSMFVKRVVRKLKSLRRGFVRVNDRFAVQSPFVVPGALGMSVSKRLLPMQIKAGLAQLGVKRPLAWITCPPGIEAVEALDPVGVVYERTDRWESLPEADTDLILGYHARIQRRADVTLYCSTLLMEEEADGCNRAAYVDHGVDYELFSKPGQVEPEDVAALPRPRVGFVGGLDRATFAPELLRSTAERLPDVQFVLVGGSTIEPEALAAPNVALLGQKPYAEVPAYMSACDVLIMPWNDSEWIRACNPIKLKEYLAVGRPIVSSPFYELRRYDGYVDVAEGPEEFAEAIRRSLAERREPEFYRARVESETWTAKGLRVLEELAALGIRPAAA